jgi:hypothetical protein
MGPFMFKEELMKRLALLSFLVLFSTNSFAEVCEGINACTELYRKLTGDNIIADKDITDETTLAVVSTDLTAQNAKAEFQLYLNKNTIQLLGRRLDIMRNGDFLTSPIYIVSENNMPQMINKDGLVTLVYHAKRPTSKLLTSKVRNQLSFTKVQTKSRFAILEFPTKIIAIQHTFEYAEKMMKKIMKADQ